MTDLTKRRFLDICHFKRPGDLCLVGTKLNGFWYETPIQWVKQGAPAFFADPMPEGAVSTSKIDEYFHFEGVRPLSEINSGLRFGFRIMELRGLAVADAINLVSPDYEPCVLEEDERTLTYMDSCGQVMRVLKENPETMPMFLDWPVKDRPSWAEFKKRLDPTTPERYLANWEAFVMQINSLACPVILEVGGFFGFMREWVGTKRLLYLFYDDPSLVEDIMETLLHLEMEIVKKVAKEIRFEVASYWEDMAYKTGSLISPAMVRKFMLPRYRRLNELLHEIGVEVIFLDSDGNLDELVPIWIEAGINFIWPFEQAAGNDVLSFRRKFGRHLVIGGGIDKRALVKGKEAIKEEVLSKVPFLLRQGGYFPSVDHLVPPDVSFENYCYFINLLREIGGLEKIEF